MSVAGVFAVLYLDGGDGEECENGHDEAHADVVCAYKYAYDEGCTCAGHVVGFEFVFVHGVAISLSAEMSMKSPRPQMVMSARRPISGGGGL